MEGAFPLGLRLLNPRTDAEKSKKEKYVRMKHIEKLKKHKCRARQKRTKYINVSLKIKDIGQSLEKKFH